MEHNTHTEIEREKMKTSRVGRIKHTWAAVCEIIKGTFGQQAEEHYKGLN